MHNASTGSPSPLGHCWGSIDLLSRFFKYWPGQENSSKVVEPCHSQNLSTLKHGHGYCFFCHRVLQPKSGGAISCTKQVWAANKVKKRTSQNHGRITDHICMFSQVWYLLNHAAHWRLTHSRLWKAVRCTLALRLFSVPVKPAQGHRNCLYFGHMTSLLNLTSLTWCTAGCWTQNGFIIFHNTMGKKNILSIVVYLSYPPIDLSIYTHLFQKRHATWPARKHTPASPISTRPKASCQGTAKPWKRDTSWAPHTRTWRKHGGAS